MITGVNIQFSKTPTGANKINRITGAEKKKGISGEKAVKNGLFQLRAGRRS
jgi:hypothetical protein